MTISFRSLLVSLLAFVAIVRASADMPAFTEVKTANGTLAGVQANGVWSFKGIPYAQPPVGDLRWREPQPAQDWTGVRRADHFGPRAIQPTLWSDMLFRSEKMSEDCLYLNVWTAAATPSDRLPVLVYFHGGGLVAGDGSELRYDGESMARQGIVMVTINYRLGILGYLAHPELTKESPHHASGNYGFLDQNAALRWVQRNIAAFGGDPQRVTIAGQSAGSASVCAQMASPLSRGLFAGAIGESGSALGSRHLPLAEGEQAGVKFAAEAGADSLAALRRLPVETLLKVSEKAQFSRGLIIDGYFLPESPQEIYFTGRQSDVPLLVGWNSAEVGYQSVLGQEPPTLDSYRAALRRLYGEHADEVLKLYPAATPAEVEQAASDLACDRFCGYRAWKWLDEASKSGGKPVFRYLYAQKLPPEKNKPAAASTPVFGPPHSAEIAYALGNLNRLEAYAWTDADAKTSAVMQGYFVNFVKSGNPNGGDLPHWPWIQASIPHIMVIQANPAIAPEPDGKRHALLDSLQDAETSR